MKITNNSLGNYAMFYEHFMELVRSKGTIVSGGYMHWCKEDSNLESLRQNAEDALEKYINAVSSMFFKEERMLNEQLLKKKTLF